MKIGVFDSGLGGLYLLKAISKKLPKYDYIFLGDTKHLPYGSKSQAQIYKLTTGAVEFLFNQNCELVIIACNTSSAQALRRIQKEYLPKKFPNKKVLGVIRPTVEMIKAGDTCILATAATVKARAYTRELHKINPHIKISELEAPELVTLIETKQLAKIDRAVRKYSDLIATKRVKNVILGCTHYAVVKDQFAKNLGRRVKLISQDEILPAKIRDYLKRHPEIDQKLAKNQKREFFVTKLNVNFANSAKQWFGRRVELILAKY